MVDADLTETPAPAKAEPSSGPEELQLLAEPAGARFYRADLQIHTPIDPRFEPKPELASPDARRHCAREYVAAARDRGIELLGVTEHNDVSWINELRQAGQELGVHVLPGFEVESKEGIHVLCLFDPGTRIEHLEDCLARLGLTKEKRSRKRLELRADKYFPDLIRFVQEECGGICIAAHIESSKGLLAAIREGARVDTWKTPELLAAQLSKPPTQITTGNGRIVRGEDPKYERDRLPAYLLTSDARSVNAIGERSTWVKLGEVSVAGLRQAFLDSETRIAYDDPSILRQGGRLLAVTWEGGFLGGVGFPLNLDLNCLIGGKGTGKSTVIETIRYAFDLDYRTDDVGNAARELLQNAFKSGSRVAVVIETGPPAPRRYIVERTAPHAPVVRDETGTPLPDVDPRALVAPCVYGQKEIYGIAQDARARLELLDGFADEILRPIFDREIEVIARCQQNGQLILDTLKRIDDAEARLAELPNLEEWRKRFKEAGFEDLLRERRQLDREQRLLEAAEAALRSRGKHLDELAAATLRSPPSTDDLPNLDLMERAREVLLELETRWSESLQELRTNLGEAQTQLAQVRREWDSRRAARSEEFDQALRELQERIPEVDPEQYLDVERRIEQLTPLRSALGDLRQRLESLRAERSTLVIELESTRGEKHRARSSAADRLNEALDGSVRIDLDYQGERESFIERVVGMRTGARGDAIRRLVEAPDFTPARFAQLVRDRRLAKDAGVPEGQASTLERGLAEGDLLELEVEELPDRVELLLDVALGEGHDYRPLGRLSPGQKSTAILLLITQESRDPLLIDQPEDDLDNRFIYDDIVRRLRTMKLSRQFLIATHNANIPVLGDAEQIVALDAKERDGGPVAGFVRARGAIDTSPVREAAEQILEGGREAFAFRRAKYGF